MQKIVQSISSHPYSQSILAASLAVAAIKLGSHIKGVRVLTRRAATASTLATITIASSMLITEKALLNERKEERVNRKKKIRIALVGLSVIILTGLLATSNVAETKFKSLPQVNGNLLGSLMMAVVISNLLVPRPWNYLSEIYKLPLGCLFIAILQNPDSPLYFSSCNPERLRQIAMILLQGEDQVDILKMINEREGFVNRMRELQRLDSQKDENVPSFIRSRATDLLKEAKSRLHNTCLTKSKPDEQAEIERIIAKLDLSQ